MNPKASKYSNEEKIALVNRIHSLDHDKYFYDIFKIIQNNEIKYSQNSNGIFISINTVPDTVIKEIEDYLNKNYTKKIGITVSNAAKCLELEQDAPEEQTKSKRLSNHEKAVIKRSYKN